MSSTYAGNSASYPTSMTMPSDGDGPGIHAVDVNVALEALADRTAYLNALLVNRIIAVKSTGPVGSTFDTQSSTPVDITGMTLSFPGALVGDIIVIHAHAQVYTTNVATAAIYTTKVLDGAGSDFAAIATHATDTLPGSLSHSWQHVVTTAGTITVKGQLSTFNVADHAHLGGDGYLNATHIRPA